MTGWTAKRFWKNVEVQEHEGGHMVTLDGRPVRTPGKALFLLPTPALAEAVAEEWRAVSDVIDPRVMPVTRIANTAIDKVSVQRAEIAAMLAAYGETDLISYRAEGPEALTERQATAWDSWIDWAADRYGATLRVARGVVPVAQDPQALRRLAEPVEAMDPFRLGPFHDLVALSGSLVLALAVADGALAPEEAWSLSRVDEDWQAELWGEDDEARAAAAEKRDAFLVAARAFRLVNGH